MFGTTAGLGATPPHLPSAAQKQRDLDVFGFFATKRLLGGAQTLVAHVRRSE
ncbi:hypothetical protein MYXA107069_13250 [Myxococcus xanthus]|nr:hypothetical protein MyxoNM_16765 [Myxococcus xanthus]SDX82081.1 hypothetical protein SAMN05444383_11379 [Myxococcus xanthus]